MRIVLSNKKKKDKKRREKFLDVGDSETLGDGKLYAGKLTIENKVPEDVQNLSIKGRQVSENVQKFSEKGRQSPRIGNSTEGSTKSSVCGSPLNDDFQTTDDLTPEIFDLSKEKLKKERLDCMKNDN
eukprot:Trichotokara_eunicae@DN2450_c0_g1_i1.p2